MRKHLPFTSFLFCFLLHCSNRGIAQLNDTSLWHNETRELRYKPDGEDFVITNGKRLFTRALYGTHTAFRIEAGDRPEFALYMPGMGGNFKIGIESGGNSKWLTNAKKITARYRPGSMIYDVEDELMGSGRLTLQLLALPEAEGFILKSVFSGLNKPVNQIWAFGGASGKKFSRDGDMGPDPESSFYLKPENCRDNIFTVGSGTFTLRYGTGLQLAQDGSYIISDQKQEALKSREKVLSGTFSPATILKVADAGSLETPLSLYQSEQKNSPVLAGRIENAGATDQYFIIQNPGSGSARSFEDAPALFLQAETRRKQIAGRITINTPDPFINTIGGALAIASDATWEAPTYLHGSVGWRMRLNGWRGAYTADALGWHDRARTHLEAYAQSQVTTPLSGPVVPDTAMHWARSLEKLGTGMFTSGYISREPEGKNLRAHHYDMNLVYIDILLRHYAWTGDLDFLKKTWPVLKRHLEWETRNFDADRDGLYDAYASIWASDALQYSGGGVAHSSAYNHLAFRKAAAIATLLGENPGPYLEESEKILKAMQSILWMPAKGTYAEFKDLLGNRLLHPSAALWTIYHCMDSETLDPFQSYQSTRYVDTEIPHIPVKAKGLKDGGYHTLSTTSWMPYTWSLNNVALGESMHTALAYWQAGRKEEAFRLFKSEVLASMYLGGSPGNFVQISHYDAIRGEAYRDFGDPVGISSRALVEGLFGIVPDALNNRFTIRPGIPADWSYASFATPDIQFDFGRNNTSDSYSLVQQFQKKLDLRLQVVARGQVESIIVNGKRADWKNCPASVGNPVIEINAPAADKYQVTIKWQAAEPSVSLPVKTVVSGHRMLQKITGANIVKVYDPGKALTNIKINASNISARIVAQRGHATIFLQVSKGSLLWWQPLNLKVEKLVSLVPQNKGESNNRSFRLLNNSDSNLRVSVAVGSFQSAAVLPPGKYSGEIRIPDSALTTGTNQVSISTATGFSDKEYLVDWSATATKSLETIDINSYYNDKVTQIFGNKYVSPRPSVTTLQLPWQGTGDWPHPLETHDINDAGLRKLAGDKNSFGLPQGVPFSTPGKENENNILFTSQWDNYPGEASILLSGHASHAWFMMAGSTNPMQSQFNNGSVTIEYTDGTSDSLALRNPETWWPIEEDYYTDGFAFSLKQPRPVRIHLKTGLIVQGEESKAKFNGKEIEGGAATVLDLSLDISKTLKQLTLRTLANDVVIGLMSVTLQRE